MICLQNIIQVTCNKLDQLSSERELTVLKLGDHYLNTTFGRQQWSQPQNACVELTYPKFGYAEVITYLEVITEQVTVFRSFYLKIIQTIIANYYFEFIISVVIFIQNNSLTYKMLSF